MSTIKQRKLVSLLPRANWNISRAALMAGYSPNSAKNPHILMKGIGIKEIMENYGLSEEEILREHKKVIMQDKNLPAKNTAIDMIYKIKGLYAPKKTENKNLNIDETLKGKDLDKKIQETIEELKRLNE